MPLCLPLSSFRFCHICYSSAQTTLFIFSVRHPYGIPDRKWSCMILLSYRDRHPISLRSTHPAAPAWPLWYPDSPPHSDPLQTSESLSQDRRFRTSDPAGTVWSRWSLPYTVSWRPTNQRRIPLPEIRPHSGSVPAPSQEILCWCLPWGT